jgi:hypothetical protein
MVHKTKKKYEQFKIGETVEYRHALAEVVADGMNPRDVWIKMLVDRNEVAKTG